MRQDIYEYLHELGWAYSHTTEDGRRIWNRQVNLNGTKTTVTRYEEEKHLLEAAMDALDA